MLSILVGEILDCKVFDHILFFVWLAVRWLPFASGFPTLLSASPELVRVRRMWLRTPATNIAILDYHAQSSWSILCIM